MLSGQLIAKQQQMLSTQQIQALDILNLTNQELSEYLTNEYLENPLMESTEKKEDSMLENIEHLYEYNSYNQHEYSTNNEQQAPRQDLKTQDKDVLERNLLEQLDSKKYTKEEWQLLKHLIHCLDEKGFFTFHPDEIASVLHINVETVEKCLCDLKSLEPIGIFSRDINECLRAQLLAANYNDPVLLEIVDSYMDEILQGHISAITRNLHISSAKVKEYIHIIGSLNPRPIMNREESHTEYIVPDIIVNHIESTSYIEADCREESWAIQLNDQWMGEYRFNDYYVKSMKTTADPELKEYFLKKYQRAKFIFDAVEQRRNTILSVMKVIISMQEDYLLKNAPLKPMTMEQVAQETGFHVSTVSRAIKGKYIQFLGKAVCCHNISLVKDFFTTAVCTSSAADPDREDSTNASSTVSSDEIKHYLREYIESEDKNKPYSDQKLADLLSARGILISKRTVTKYRNQENIPDYRKRKLFGL